jgi:hypothetical protein
LGDECCSEESARLRRTAQERGGMTPKSGLARAYA